MSRFRIVSCVAVLIVSCAFVSSVEARSKRATQVPNNEWTCGLCHTDPTGDSPRNDFGQQVEANLSEPKMQADVDWQAIYDLDADGDGFTNGEELGDPNGEWEIGDDAPEAEPTHPADAEDYPETGGGDGDAGGGSDDTGIGGESDAGSTADTGQAGVEGDSGYACSAVDGEPVRGLWVFLVFGLVAVRRRK